MPLPTVPCTGKTTVEINDGTTISYQDLIFECVKIKKVFDEFALRDCVEGIVFHLERRPVKDLIDPVLILRNCTLTDVEVKDVSTDTEKRLRFMGKCCCEVYGKDAKGNIIRMKVKEIPTNNKLSIGPDGELCFSFNVRREYPDATEANFEKLIHFLDEGRFEIQCLCEAIIDEENNETECEILVTNLGIFIAVKFDAEVQLCIPVLGYCDIEEDISSEENFCDKFETDYDVPDFNPPQLDKEIGPYGDNGHNGGHNGGGH